MNMSTPEFELKPLSKSAIPRALEKIEQYRLLNEPMEAESICRDILAVDPDNQKGIVELILTLTDQFQSGVPANEANSLLEKLKDPYHIKYYQALILERQGKAALKRGYPGSNHDAFEWLEEAMHIYEEADKLSEGDNNDAVLRWNTCARIIQQKRLSPRPKDDSFPVLE